MGALALDYAPKTRPTPPAGSGWTGVTKRIWLLLCAEGGFWTAQEIRSKLGLHGALYTLQDMLRGGNIVQRKRRTVDGDQVVEYGVVRKCKIPRGVSWEEIEELRRPHGQGKTPAPH